MNISIEIVIVLALIAVNGLFAMAEMAVVSARRTRLQERADQGDKGAQQALEVADSPSRFLSTIQIGITLIGVLAGAFGGATLAQELAEALADVRFLAPYSEGIAVAAVVAVITYLSLVLGELVPKELALNNPERIASAVTPPIHALSKLAAPLVSLLTASTHLVMRLLRVQPSGDPPVTESEIRIMLEAGTQAGVFEETEQDMVHGVFRLGDRRVDAVMTPRTEIEWLDTDDSPEQIEQAIARSTHSRFPVAAGHLDQVKGVVRARDVLSQRLAGGQLDLESLLQACAFVPESTPALKVFNTLKGTGRSMAFIIDEYGGLQGLVTMTDIVEAIVGDLSPADELDEARVVQREDGSWLLDGLLPVDEFKELLGLDALPGEDEAGYQTLGGFVMHVLGHIPRIADQVVYDTLEIEVVDMDAHRVDRVSVRRREEP